MSTSTTLGELHRLIAELRADNRLGDIGLSVGLDEDRAALLDAIRDPSPITIN
ncbi:MAG TPA: hypothetical protein VI259_28360 [Gemmatimonadaceae bacterium]